MRRFNKFNSIYESVIAEAYNWFRYDDIIRATLQVTHNCADDWTDETGREVLALVTKAGKFSRENESHRG